MEKHERKEAVICTAAEWDRDEVYLRGLYLNAAEKEREEMRKAGGG